MSRWQLYKSISRYPGSSHACCQILTTIDSNQWQSMYPYLRKFHLWLNHLVMIIDWPVPININLITNNYPLIFIDPLILWSSIFNDWSGQKMFCAIKFIWVENWMCKHKSQSWKLRGISQVLACIFNQLIQQLQINFHISWLQ